MMKIMTIGRMAPSLLTVNLGKSDIDSRYY